MLKAPHQRLFEHCRENGAKSAWAVGSGTTSNGVFCWEIYLEDKNDVDKLPNGFEGDQVHAILCPKPKQ